MTEIGDRCVVTNEPFLYSPPHEILQLPQNILPQDRYRYLIWMSVWFSHPLMCTYVTHRSQYSQLNSKDYTLNNNCLITLLSMSRQELMASPLSVMNAALISDNSRSLLLTESFVKHCEMAS